MFSAKVLTCISIFYYTWMTSSGERVAELRGTNTMKKSGLMSQSFVSSSFQCLHKCQRTKGCNGMNLGKSTDGKLTCQLTSSMAASDDGDEVLQKLEGWHYYRVIDPINWLPKKKIYIYLSSYTKQQSSDAPNPYSSSTILINGEKTPLSKGLNVVSFPYDDVARKSFKTFSNPTQLDSCVSFLNMLQKGFIIGIVVVDTAVLTMGDSLPPLLMHALRRVGVTQTNIKYRQTFCFISMVGKTVPWGQEVLMKTSEPSICEAEVY